MTDDSPVSPADPSAFGEEIKIRAMGPRTQAVYDHLMSRVIGQDRSARRIAQGFTIFNAGLKDPRLPIYVGLFAGPTGTGKTFTAETIARHLIADLPEAPLTRIVCTGLTERHDVSRLVGSAPGYVGYGDASKLHQQELDHHHFSAKLTNPRDKSSRAAKKLVDAARSGNDAEAMKKALARARELTAPFYSVIVFDEIEKAHSSIWKLLLNMTGDGSLPMGDGSTTSFANSVIILTSNVGGRDQQERFARKRVGFSSLSVEAEKRQTDGELRELTLKRIKETFDPEFIGRIQDQIIVFRPLTVDDARRALYNRYDEVNSRINEGRRDPILLTFSDAFTDFVLREGFNQEYGMWPLDQTVKRQILLPLAAALEAEDIRDGDTVTFTMRGDAVCIRRAGRPVQAIVTLEQVDVGWDDERTPILPPPPEPEEK